VNRSECKEVCVGVTAIPKETAWLTAEVVAVRCNVGSQAVYGWLRKGWLSGYKFGGTWRIAERDLDVFLSTSRHEANERGERIESQRKPSPVREA